MRKSRPFCPENYIAELCVIAFNIPFRSLMLVFWMITSYLKNNHQFRIIFHVSKRARDVCIIFLLHKSKRFDTLFLKLFPISNLYAWNCNMCILVGSITSAISVYNEFKRKMAKHRSWAPVTVSSRLSLF